MVLSHSSDLKESELKKLHFELCRRLDVQSSTATTAWETFESISKKYVLEGDKIHWLGCAVYAASQRFESNSSGNNLSNGSGLSLTNLLKHTSLSLVKFFSNILRWADMAQLSDDFRSIINQLRNNYSITYNTFKKFHPLYSEIFVSPVNHLQEWDNSRSISCTSTKLFEFVWNLFLVLKSDDKACSSELIKSHLLLYCCLDLALINVVSAKRIDLLNSNVAEEVSNCNSVKDLPCLVKRFCKDETLTRDGLHMKVYTFKPMLNRLIDREEVLTADRTEFIGLLEAKNFERNYKNVMVAYEDQLATQNCIDERFFIADFKRKLIEKEQAEQSWTLMKSLPAADGSILESPKVTGTNIPKGLDTPLTGRKFLGPRENDGATRSVSENKSKLYGIIGDRQPEPSEALKNIFRSCQRDPVTKIENLLSKMKVQFIDGYTSNGFSEEDAQKKTDLAVTLFYKYVELILKKEQSITKDISVLVEKEVFYQCMFACCLEIVLYCYNFPKKFPWILDTLNVEPMHFFKVIELIVRAKDNLFRELVKHLNRIEETVIESLAWRSDSPIWEAIKTVGQIPKFEDIALPGHLSYESQNEHMIQSPGPLSASDCFQSPFSQMCRNIFPGSMTLQFPKTEGETEEDDKNETRSILKTNGHSASKKPGGSLSIIFRKFYNLAGVRMQHLCSYLGFEDVALKRKIWTIFEDSIRHTDLIKDRHLDQLLMCAIYVICKAGNITNIPNLFAIIMKYYRLQPQACSSVYRDVLIERKTKDGETVEDVRNDLIQFYNSVYVKAMQSYAVRFQPKSTANVWLSPLPANRKSLVSPNTQVIGNVFVKPLESPVSQSGPTYNYYFNRSPSKDLMNINRAINGNPIQGKRLLIDVEGTMPTTKRLSHRKIQSLVEERQRQNNLE
ncbi:retinoblastoma-like protein 2 [Anthonomus grandis grandis]|uniref:retinoblastoma-like protein 2 n=1 Tax=Anthonomus grandis grandis TaxID=2921223 RepID=UPI0021664BD3|nr:retinoblastoma-like protein 2 [Anthonomus grandis grandis]